MRGRYRIDGNAALFVYDDGHKVLKAFGFLNDDRTHIALDGTRFIGRKQRGRTFAVDCRGRDEEHARIRVRFSSPLSSRGFGHLA